MECSNTINIEVQLYNIYIHVLYKMFYVWVKCINNKAKNIHPLFMYGNNSLYTLTIEQLRHQYLSITLEIFITNIVDIM